MNAPWPTHVENLKAHYNPANKQDVLREQLERLKQDSNIIDHIYKFDTIVNQIYNMSEYDKIRNFMKSLNKKTEANVKAQMPATLLKAKEIAIKIDDFVPRAAIECRCLQSRNGLRSKVNRIQDLSKISKIKSTRIKEKTLNTITNLFL